MTTTNPNRASPRYWLRLIAFTATALLVVFLLALGCLVYGQVRRAIDPVRKLVVGSPADVNLAYEEVTLNTADGLKISAWYIPGTNSNAIILVHGITANRRFMLPQAALLAEAGYHLLLLDLRGHGNSEGTEVTYGYREALDVQAAVDYLVTLPNVKHIGAIGYSLGGAAVARAAAADQRIEAVVIESSYSSLPEAIEDAFGQLTILPRWPFAPLIVGLAERRIGVKVSEIDPARDLATLHPRAVMIIHGTDDDLLPLHHGLKMYKAAQEPKELWVVEGLGHDDPAPGHEEEYRQRVVTFFDTAFSAQ